MVDPLMLLAFLPAGLALNITPGADMMFCLGQGLRAGPRAAWAASAGVALGAVIHTAVAGLGLAALIAQAPWSFEVIRWLGVGYLLWLAWQGIRHAGRPPAQAHGGGRAFRDGLVVNLTNPKVALFVLAFVPQFINPQAGPILLQFLTFGMMLAVGGLIVNGCVGHFAGRLRHRLSRGSAVLDYVTSTLFAALALRLAIMERI